MAKWTAFYKVYSPKTTPTTTTEDGLSSVDFSSYSWLKTMIGSSQKRISKYSEYDLMDQDVEVARALDTIAEEICGNNPDTDLPIEIEMQGDQQNSSLHNSMVLTLKAALRYWCDVHDWESKLYQIARNTIKYGDCFFLRGKTIDKPWRFVNAKNVQAAVVDQDDPTRVMRWIIHEGGLSNISSLNNESIKHSDDVIRFTLDDSMSELAPFGTSVLQDVYKTYQQKELLESSIIIYRLRNAPEKRVYYIDVGTMPPQRAKMYLEQVKNEIKSKKIPTILGPGGTETVDSIYNPTSMNEEIFLASRADGRGSKVETLAGGQQLGEITDLEYFQNKLWSGLKIPPSYMRSSSDKQAQFNDGKVGVAYILELRFAIYVQRLQIFMEKILDAEFKRYIKSKNIHIDSTQFKLRLPAPSNFGIYRKQELDAALMQSFSSADNIPYLSKRFNLTRYLNLSDDEIALNEKMLREEKGLDHKAPLDKVYGAQMDTGMGMPDMSTSVDTGIPQMDFGDKPDVDVEETPTPPETPEQSAPTEEPPKA